MLWKRRRHYIRAIYRSSKFLEERMAKSLKVDIELAKQSCQFILSRIIYTSPDTLSALGLKTSHPPKIAYRKY